MTTNIIAFQPEKRGQQAIELYELYQPISNSQFRELTSEANDAGSWFESNGLMITKHVNNRLKYHFNVSRIEDIPRVWFDEALSIINQAKEEAKEFYWFHKDLLGMFAEKVIRDGIPWVPSLRKKWCKKMGKDLPDRPNWQALAEEIAAYEERRKS
ncbi:MAG: hypothetical protein AB2660_15295 [Candidatus Thiodiazotropha sp.]